MTWSLMAQRSSHCIYIEIEVITRGQTLSSLWRMSSFAASVMIGVSG